MAGARVIQVETTAWLIVDEVLHPRFLIRYGPAVNRETHETLMMYRVDRWALDREKREPVAWRGTYEAAAAWCREQVERPDMTRPAHAGYGSAVTPEEQQRRWDAGLDPVTGEPRTS